MIQCQKGLVTGCNLHLLWFCFSLIHLYVPLLTGTNSKCWCSFRKVSIAVYHLILIWFSRHLFTPEAIITDHGRARSILIVHLSGTLLHFLSKIVLQLSLYAITTYKYILIEENNKRFSLLFYYFIFLWTFVAKRVRDLWPSLSLQLLLIHDVFLNEVVSYGIQS